MDLMRLCRLKTGLMKIIAVFGTRISGKSVGCQNAIADHLWNTKDASVLILCYTAGAAATSGIWNELTEKILPEWIAQGFGSEDGQNSFEWEMEPKIHGSTKKIICSVRNKYGGVSKLELDSLDDEREVEKKFKSRYYSMIYWSEAGEFRQELTLTTLMMALRIMGLPDDEHILLIDANPPDNGTEHFLYKFFYELRIAREEDCDAAEKLIRRCLHLTEWNMNDNPFVSDERKALVKKMYEKNPNLYDRYVLGKWTMALKDALFADVFAPSIHCSGDIKNPDPMDELVPESGCVELITGHDVGGVNPVSYIIEKVYRNENGKEVSVFKFLDELAFIGEEITVEEFFALFMEKMDYWERECGQTLDWSACWADLSALNFRESISGRTVADEAYLVTNGRIKMIGVDKGRGSVAMRIRLLRKLLIQNRIIISPKCPRLIEMFQAVNRGKTDGSVAAHSKHRHALDGGGYPLTRELWNELQDDLMLTRKMLKPQSAGLVTVRL